MSNEQDKGIIIILGNVGKIWEDGDRVIVKVGIRGREGCPYCGSGNLYRHVEGARNTGCEMLEILKDKDKIYLGIDEHSFRHQELVYTITEVKS